MPTPQPSQIVTNPQPLNPAGFPFRVQPFPTQWLLQIGDFNVPADPRPPAPGNTATNYEPGQH